MKTLEKDIIRDSFGWDVRNWSRAIPFWEKHLGDIKGKKALELGNGGKFGGLSLWLAYKGAEVICSDYKGVSNEAKAIHAKHGYSERIRYEVIDATKIPYKNAFDIVSCKSVLGGIIRNKNIRVGSCVVDEVYKTLNENGHFLVCENGYATPVHHWLRNKYGAGKNEWKYFKLSELKKILRKYSISYFKTYGFLGCFGRTEMQRNLLAMADSIASPLLPDHSQYIIFSISQK